MFISIRSKNLMQAKIGLKSLSDYEV